MSLPRSEPCSPPESCPLPAWEAAAVLGSGSMGARIAALLVNAGLRVSLLDLAAEGGDRNAIVRRGWQRALAARPPALESPELARRVTLGNFDDDLARLQTADWVIEAVSEDLAVKRALLEKIAPHLGPRAVLSTNTSGLSIAEIGAALPAAMRRRWLGTHFFNPPRYLHLLELIATPETAGEAAEAVAAFCELRLGKGVLRVADTPNFIANRVGAYSFACAAQATAEFGLRVEVVDALTGPLLGWPKSATFRTADIVGLDVLRQVVENARRRLPHDSERERYRLPPYMEEMLRRGWLGEKSGRGFYERIATKGEAGAGQILALDLAKMEYQPRRRPELAALQRAQALPEIGARLRALLLEAPAEEPARRFLWRTLGDLWLYCARILPELDATPEAVDHAMRWGFNWELGPFELWDAAGLAATLAHWKNEARALPPVLGEMAGAGATSWYQTTQPPSQPRLVYHPAQGRYAAPAILPPLSLAAAPELRRNSSCSLRDLGEGIGCLEFHSKLNLLGPETVALVSETLAECRGASPRFRALVVGNEGAQFSAGANLMLLLLEIEEENWEDITLAVEQFQRMNLALKRSPIPVVAAPFALALGGGCELMLSAPRVVAHAELYAGLVELGVGLIPAGGGTTQMALRAMRGAGLAVSGAAGNAAGNGAEHGAMERLQSAFAVIARGKVSGSALEARRLGLLEESAVIVANRDRLLYEARAEAARLAERGSAPRLEEDVIACGATLRARLELGVWLLRESGSISEYDALLARKLAFVLCGGDAPAGARLSEEAVLGLEREAFLSLCGEARTRDRIAHMLKTGKPLRN